MKIQYLPEHYMDEVTHIFTDTVWRYGEIKDIPEDATFRQKIAGQSHIVRWVDDLLSSPNFVLAESKINPNFTCVECGKEALEDGRTNDFGTTYFENEAGERLCSGCFDKPKPKKSAKTAQEK